MKASRDYSIRYSRMALAAALAGMLNSIAPVQASATAGLDQFYSEAGREHVVEYTAELKTRFSSLSEVQALTEAQKKSMERSSVLPVVDFLFGPLGHSGIASPLRVQKIALNFAGARLVGGTVHVPYSYSGVWIIDANVAAGGVIRMPIPFNRQLLDSTGWKKCTDSEPSHQTSSFYWYFWDPTRYGCDHKEGVHYQYVTAKIGKQTQQTEKTYPEYDRMLADGVMKITLAFGYNEEPAQPNPEKDYDVGVTVYREFVRNFRNQWGTHLKEETIFQTEYRGGDQGDLVIGRRFSGYFKGKQVLVNIVVAAGLDPMDLFAKSFAHDHDDLFGWFGHSRVGSNFDADRFGQLVRNDPQYYSITNNYQLIYWAGCNSYSYYTVPFFDFKGGAANLDIVANGMPSYFTLNDDNAMIASKVLLGWDPAQPVATATSYQNLIETIETRAQQEGITVLSVVVGDEDNKFGLQ